MALLSMLLVYFVIILFLLYTYKNKKPIRWNKVLNAFSFGAGKNDDIHRIPGPARLPVFGTKWNTWFTNMGKLHEYYGDLNKQYGDVVVEMMGSVPVVSLFKRRDIEKVLKHPSDYPFRPPNEIVSFYRNSRPDRYETVGMVNSQGENWAHLRSMLTPKTLESRQVLARFCPELNEICDDFISQIRQRRTNEDIVENADDLLKSMSFESSCCLILGKRMGFLSETPDMSDDFKELASAMKSMFKRIRDAYYGNGLWKYFPNLSKTYRDYVKNEELAYEIVLNIIKETMTIDKELMDCETEAPSLLKTILNTEPLDIREKISAVIDFLTAGIETVSHTVAFILYYLSTNPEAQEKIYQETCDMTFELTVTEVKAAHYTRAAIQEAFRLSPAAFAVARILEKDFYLSDYHLKPGTVVLCQNMIACSKNENFENASEYRPERWLNADGKFDQNQCPSHTITLPFGTGKRMCPGKKFTELQLTILIMKLVRSFKIKYHSKFEKQFEFILAPKTPVNIQFCDR